MKKKLIFLYLICCIAGLQVFAQEPSEPDTAAIDTSDYISGDLDYNLLIAAYRGYSSEILRLLNLGADINTVSYDGVTPLMYAAEKGHFMACKVLILNGADLEKKPENGITALMSAVRANYLNIAELLIRNGADINTTDEQGVTPLIYAVSYNYYTMTDMLLYYDINISMKDNEGTDALMTACFDGFTGIAKLLIDSGANVNAQDHRGRAPLHMAVQNNYPDIVKLLLDNKAYVDIRTISGHTPLSIAIMENNYKMAKLLIDNKADVNKKITGTITPLDLCYLTKNDSVTDLLKSSNAHRNPLPYFRDYSIGMGLDWSNHDFFTGINFNLVDVKFGFTLGIGYAFRPKAANVLTQSEPTVYYQYWERRSIFYADLGKNTNLFRINERTNIGISLGLSGALTYGSYRGSTARPGGKLCLSPSAGAYLQSGFFRIKAGYRYIDFNVNDISPNRVGFELEFILKNNKKRYLNKTIPWQ